MNMRKHVIVDRGLSGRGLERFGIVGGNTHVAREFDTYASRKPSRQQRNVAARAEDQASCRKSSAHNRLASIQKYKIQAATNVKSFMHASIACTDLLESDIL